jgi:hypothetical protein
MMKYIISESKMTRLVGELVKQVYPDFANGKCYVEEMGDEDNPTIHFFNDIIYAKYNLWHEELQLRKDLFDTLESYFGEDKMVYVIDWFNDEFGMNAESVTF